MRETVNSISQDPPKENKSERATKTTTRKQRNALFVVIKAAVPEEPQQWQKQTEEGSGWIEWVGQSQTRSWKGWIEWAKNDSLDSLAKSY